MGRPLIIHECFRGPPDAGNGGYVSGLVAALLGSAAAAEVTLRRRAPLRRPLASERRGRCLFLLDGDAVIAEGEPGAVDVETPAAVTFAEATAASRSYPGFNTHPFPGCFVCGPQRREGEGLRLFAGRLPGSTVVAAPWLPHPALAGQDGFIRPEFVWAALDCPGGWAILDHAPGRLAVLGRLAARLHAPVLAEERYVVMGWPLGAEGRKIFAGTALYSDDGRLCAAARATWFRVTA